MGHRTVMTARRIELGQMVREIINVNLGNCSLSRAARELAFYTRTKPNSLNSYLSSIRRETAGLKFPADPTKVEGLEKLTVVLYSLGVSAEERVIQELKRTYPLITYPPVNYEQIPRIGRYA
ncbi:MAG: hypothetical protein V2A62_02600 [Candidatus Woesearchaeota archaeon]